MTSAFIKLVIPAKAGIQFSFVVALLSVFLTAGAADDKDKKPVPPPTKRTQALRPETFKKLEAVQKSFDAKDYKGALAGLDSIKAGFDKLNDYEKATLYNLYAAVYYSQNNIGKAIEAYQAVLGQNALAEGMRNATLYALAQMYFIQENYDKAVATLKSWFAVAGEDQPDGHVLLAQIYYQQQNYKASEKSVLNALRIAKARQQQPKENWLALLRAVYYELKEYAKSAQVLEILIAYYPDKGTYWSQLAGMYGLLERQKDQIKVLHVAYSNNLLSSEGDLLNLTRLYMLEETPYPAVLVLKQGFKAKTIKETPANLQLYAQALALAKEYEMQIPVLEQLAKETRESKHYVYLGQALGELQRWKDAADSFKAALNAKEVHKPATIRMQLGTALFNAGRLSEARDVFAVAAESEELARQATNWIRFVDSEIQKKQALRAG